MRIFRLSILILSLYLRVNAQEAELHGKITGSEDQPLQYVSAWIVGMDKGTITNAEGVYRIYLKPGVYKFSFRSPGYQPVLQTIKIGNNTVINDVHLSRIAPANSATIAADSIISKVISTRDSYINQLPGYTGVIYNRELQGLKRLPKNFLKKDLAHELHLNPNRKGIINLKESIAEFHTRENVYTTERLIAEEIASNSRDVFNFNRTPEMRADFYKDILHFDGFNEHAFLSPIAGNALKYYRYRLTGQFTDHDVLIYKISVEPRHRDEHLFNGTIYVVNKRWLLYGVDLHLSRNAHLDFVDSVSIRQQYVPVNSGNWVRQANSLNFYGKFTGFHYSGLFLTVYQDIKLDTALLAKPLQRAFYSDREDYQRDGSFWQQNRPVLLTPEEQQFYRLTELADKHKKDKAIVDSLQNKNNRLRIIPFFLKGYTLHNYNNNSSWSFQSPYNMVFYNTVEGWGIDLKVKYFKYYDTLHNLTIIPEARYGFSDKIPNANVFVNYTYNSFKQASVYGRIGTDFLDLNNTGTISLFLNSLSTLFLGSNYVKLYQSRFVMAGTDGEIANGILLNGQLEYSDRRPLFNTTTHTFNKDSVLLTSNNPLDPNGNAPLFPHYRALIFKGSATFTFDQQYLTAPSGKYILPNPYPRVRVNFRKGIPELGSDVNYNFLSVDVFQDKLNMGLLGYTAYFLSAGGFLDARRLYYPDYTQFHGGESFFFDSFLGSFHFLNYYTYSTYKPYLQANVEHNFSGYFLSRVPLINKLNLQEIVGGSFLRQGTLPDYKEVYIGLKRTVVRLDYGLAFGRFTNRVQGFRLMYNF